VYIRAGGGVKPKEKSHSHSRVVRHAMSLDLLHASGLFQSH